jgi:hypothetical protein
MPPITAATTGSPSAFFVESVAGALSNSRAIIVAIIST